MVAGSGARRWWRACWVAPLVPALLKPSLATTPPCTATCPPAACRLPEGGIPHGSRLKIRLRHPGGWWVDRIPAWIKWATGECFLVDVLGRGGEVG